MVPLCSVFGFYGNTEQVHYFENDGKIWLFAIAYIGIGYAKTHTKFFGEPCLGETSLLQMLLDKVDMLFLSHRMIVYLGYDYKVMNL